MPFDPTLLKKVLITILIIAGLFTGYTLLTPADEVKEATTEASASEAGYADEEVERFDTALSPNDDGKIYFDNSFEHTKPGEYSEIIVNAEGFDPGEFTIVYVRLVDSGEYIEAPGQEQVADSDGKISTRFIITQFGDYEVLLSHKGESVVSETISVQ